jgi:hypothetical protein
VKFNDLIKSDRYKESRYVIQTLNEQYVLKSKYSDIYVDLCNYNHQWRIMDSWFRDCKGCKSDVISAFNYRVPIIEVIKELKEF